VGVVEGRDRLLPGLLPLVIEVLADPNNFLALQLYEALPPDEGLGVQWQPDDKRTRDREQRRTRDGVKAWFAKRSITRRIPLRAIN
jgi:hypothetical protein